MFLDNSSQKPDNQTLDDLFHLCWKLQDCWKCLHEGPSCSWCPVSSTCVPNPSTFHILAPISHADICPLESERWELRAQCLDCHVSTITFLTSIVSICSTLIVIGLVITSIRLVRRFQTWRSQNRTWWKVWRIYRADLWLGWRPGRVGVREQDSADQRPLLGDT